LTKPYVLKKIEKVKDALFEQIKASLEDGKAIELDTWTVCGIYDCSYSTARSALAFFAYELPKNPKIRASMKKTKLTIEPAPGERLIPSFEERLEGHTSFYKCPVCSEGFPHKYLLKEHFEEMPGHEGGC